MADKDRITIAIDGYSSCGKSTLAKDLAKKLGYIFIDSGAMYRAVTLYAVENNLIMGDEINHSKLVDDLDKINLSFENESSGNLPEMHLNDRNVSQEIRSKAVSDAVSYIARVPEVRTKLVAIQREIGKNGGVVMDGRDIGSVVFPDAELKIFVTANIETRTDRRFNELIEKGLQVTKEEVKQNLLKRDHIDSTREISPLIQVNDAVLIDNTHLNRAEQLAIALQLVESKLNKQN